jgi:hypothetical protein
MRPIAQRAAVEAFQNVGVQETGDNAGPAVETYQKACIPQLQPGAPWCAAFVVYRLRNAAHDLELSIPASWPRSGYCPDHGRWAKANGCFVPASEALLNPDRVRVGDLAIFYFRALKRFAHIGIVTKVFDWGVHTVEGNTEPEVEDLDRVQREGDGVYSKIRHWKEMGSAGGFIRIDW